MRCDPLTLLLGGSELSWRRYGSRGYTCAEQSGRFGITYLGIGVVVDLVVMGVVAGVLGTLAMDSLNFLSARTGMLSRIDVGMIGRMAVGWARGRFCYGHPTEIEQVANEMLYGYVTHYTIGVGLALP